MTKPTYLTFRLTIAVSLFKHGLVHLPQTTRLESKLPDNKQIIKILNIFLICATSLVTSHRYFKSQS